MTQPARIEVNKTLSPEPEPDREQLEIYYDVIFKHAGNEGYLAFRNFHNDKGDELIFTGSIALAAGRDRIIDYAFNMARNAAHNPRPLVFCSPLAVFNNRDKAREEDLQHGLVLTAECDIYPLEAKRRLEKLFECPATMTVESGGEWTNPATGEVEPKLHLHWRLKEPTITPAEHGVLREARRLMAELVRADKSAGSIVHPMRWAGSWHRKAIPRLAKIIEVTESEIDLYEPLSKLRELIGRSMYCEPGQHPGGEPKTADQLVAHDPGEVLHLVRDIPNNDLERRDWKVVCMSIFAATNGSDIGKQAWREFSVKSSKHHSMRTVDREWRSCFKSPPTKVGMGTIRYLWRQAQVAKAGPMPEWMVERITVDAGKGTFIDTPNGFVLDAEEPEPRQSSPEPEQAPPPVSPPRPSFAVEPVDLWGNFDAPPMPLGLLPKLIEDFALARGQVMGCDPGGVALAALVTCAAAITDEIKLQPKRHDTTWLESARINGMLIGDPSAKKTPAIKAATKPLVDINSGLADRYRQQRNVYDQLSKEEKRTARKPKNTRTVIYNTTIEALQEILQDSPRGVMLQEDELSGWFGAMYKYSAGNRAVGADRAFWLHAYDGGPMTVDRMSRNTHITNLSVSAIGGIQPGPLRAIADSGEDDGLLQRFLPYIMRPSSRGSDRAPGPLVPAYEELINRLYGLEPPGHPEMRPSVLRFDDDALAIRERLEQKHLDMMQLEGLNRKLTSHIGKYDGIFARLCVIWHCIEYCLEQRRHDLPVVVPEAIARRVADFLHGFLLKHAVSFYVNVLGLANDHDRLANVADYILAKKLDVVTNRDVQHGDRSMRRLERFETEAIFQQLEALGWVSEVPSPLRSKPPRWRVNPAVHQRFAERAQASAERRQKDAAMIRQLLSGGR